MRIRNTKIHGLMLAEIITYALFEMQHYLTDVLGVSMSRAAATVNIWFGISLLLQPIFFVLADKLLGNFAILVISSLSYTVGIFLVYLSAPPVLGNSTGTCRNYSPECIGHAQTALLYTGMVLIAIGGAGNNVSLKAFLEEQERPYHPDEDNKLVSMLMKHGFVMVVPTAGSLLLPYAKRYTILTGIPAICILIATLYFLTGSCCNSYRTNGPQTKYDGCNVMFSRKAIPAWLVFIVPGIVSSIGKTYSVEQARHLDRNHIGTWKVPTQVLLLVQNSLIKAMVYVPRTALKRRVTWIIIQILAVLCCIAAAIVEIKRLGIVRSHGLLDKPHEDIPMSMYWLLFQFVLLGCLDALLDKSTAAYDIFLIHRGGGIVWEPRCFEVFSKGIVGVGFMLNVPLVIVIQKLTAWGDNPSWFQSTANQSRLDLYYWTLAGLSAATLLTYVVAR